MGRPYRSRKMSRNDFGGGLSQPGGSTKITYNSGGLREYSDVDGATFFLLSLVLREHSH